MNLLRAFHWWITVVLFGIAFILYLADGVGAAAGVATLGIAFELAAWLSLAWRPDQESSDTSDHRFRGLK